MSYILNYSAFSQTTPLGLKSQHMVNKKGTKEGSFSLPEFSVLWFHGRGPQVGIRGCHRMMVSSSLFLFSKNYLKRVLVTQKKKKF